jgi:hypothetical protein
MRMHKGTAAGWKFAILALVIWPQVATAEFERTDPGAAQATGNMKADVRPWDLSVRTYAGHDTNVGLSADISGYNGELESGYYGAAIQGSYRFVQTQDWNLGVSLYAGRVVYAREHRGDETDAPSEYNTSVLNPGIYAQRRLSFGTMPLTVGLAYNFRREWVSVSAGGLNSHSISANALLHPTRGFAIGAFAEYADENFSIVFPDPALNSRDATRFAVGILAQLKLNRGRTRITASYSHGENQAEGSNWDNTSNNVEIRVQSRLMGPVFVDVSGGLYDKDYDGYVSTWLPPPGRNHQQDYGLEAKLLWAIAPHVIADAHFKSHWHRANTDYFEADRRSYGLGLAYRF